MKSPFVTLRNFDHVVQLVLNTVAMRYTTAILQKRLTLKTQDDRKLVAERIMSVSLDYWCNSSAWLDFFS